MYKINVAFCAVPHAVAQVAQHLQHGVQYVTQAPSLVMSGLNLDFCTKEFCVIMYVQTSLHEKDKLGYNPLTTRSIKIELSFPDINISQAFVLRSLTVQMVVAKKKAFHVLYRSKILISNSYFIVKFIKHIV